MTQVLGCDKQGLVFEVISARISETNEEKRHVIYTILIRFVSGNDDLSPSVIERRYTHFLNLYNDLKQNFPTHMANVVFPKKVLTGNFDNELISNRSTQFESLLKHISNESKLRTSEAMQYFVQEPELTKMKDLLEKKEFTTVYLLLKNSFQLLNKVFSDRSSVVLLALCRLLGCAEKIPGMPQSLEWAELALYRFDGVSDSDLLELYIPLLYTCIQIRLTHDKDTSDLEDKLKNFQRQGMKISGKNGLLEAVEEVEKKIFNK